MTSPYRTPTPDPGPPLPSFESADTCIKCRRKWSHPSKFCKGTFKFSDKPCRFSSQEHMHVECTCGYTWAVRCLDA